MSDLNNDLSAILADFAQKSVTGGEPVVEPQPVATVVEPAPQPAAAAPQPQAPQPASTVQEPVAQVEPATPAPSTDSDIFDNWDSPTVAPAQVAAPTGSLDQSVLGELSKVLGKELKDTSGLVSELSTLKKEIEDSKKQIRPELAKAIELDQKGGDFYEYLKVSQTDWSKEDPVQLYEDYVIDSLADKDGNVDVDKVNEFLDSMPEPEKKLRGMELQRSLISEQTRKIDEIERAAISKKEKTDMELRSALTGMSEIDGFKVDDRHRKEVFDWVASGKIMKDLFYNSKGELDPAKVAKVAFRNLYYEKLDSYQKSKIRNSTKREILADLTNQQITTPAAPASPNPSKKGFDVGDYVNQLEQSLLQK